MYSESAAVVALASGNIVRQAGYASKAAGGLKIDPGSDITPNRGREQDVDRTILDKRTEAGKNGTGIAACG
jgi:hypothetical protein